MHGRTAGDTREREDDARELTDLLNEYGDTREREDDAVKADFRLRFTSS